MEADAAAYSASLTKMKEAYRRARPTASTQALYRQVEPLLTDFNREIEDFLTYARAGDLPSVQVVRFRMLQTEAALSEIVG